MLIAMSMKVTRCGANLDTREECQPRGVPAEGVSITPYLFLYGEKSA